MKFQRAVITFAALMGLASGLRAQTFDAKADYSSSQNPNGPWTYGWSTALAGPITVYPNSLLSPSSDSPYWTDNRINNGETDPYVCFHPQSTPDRDVPPLSLVCQPGPANQFTHCVWTSPAAGFYDIVASFTALAGGGPRGYLLRDGTSIGESILAMDVPQTYSFKSLKLATGETLDLAVGVGPNQSYAGDETQISFTIAKAGTQVSGTAEPVYARIEVAVAQATLGNGKQFNTAQGDCYPLIGYNKLRTMMELQFGPQTFWVQIEDAGLVPATNLPNAIAQYQNEIAKLQAIATASDAPPAVDMRTVDLVVRELAEPVRAMIREEFAKGSNHETHGTPLTQEAGNFFPVDARGDTWQNSGIRVKAGQHVLVEAKDGDTWDVGSGWGPIDAKGYPVSHDPGAGVPVFHTGVPNVDWHWGSLICAVGDGRSETNDPRYQLEIGTRKGFTVDTEGYLYFMCNDQRDFDGRDGFDDNTGIIHVKVTVTDPTESTAVTHPDPGVRN